jgi:hypothetical protein
MEMRKDTCIEYKEDITREEEKVRSFMSWTALYTVRDKRVAIFVRASKMQL